MPRFAANLTMMFTEWPFLDRFAAASDAGFEAVEYLFPYDHAADAVGAALRGAGLSQALFNLPPGDWAAGERGMAALPDRAAAVAQAVEAALPYAAATGCPTLHLMAGNADRRDAAAQTAYRSAVAATAERLEREGITLVLEPINGRDMPGYFLNDFKFSAELIRSLGLPNLQLQFDIYHRQILHGDVVMGLREMMPLIGHVQIAGVPDRHEPDSGELDAEFIFAELDRLGYGGYVGCEYRPAGKTVDGLGWFKRFARS
ncbi:2-oxo-tetronate isomerase [Acidisoma sp.]|uniref:2-oxo-tetronate isomerase n=1 Tax=Acidisoma sp. TaxID=1872115 RepID=UPI003AFFE7D8